ncbi:hypothetical protein RRG08_023880 [Elysia crispata]|uniref:Uncharacterized protein n=1 Tax=Elysia crispata TaxID=231223 RepID=A0AAE1ATN8_9GAST|nr:hypothetical protein RRG08_023880 [Elysia crispata]
MSTFLPPALSCPIALCTSEPSSGFLPVLHGSYGQHKQEHPRSIQPLGKRKVPNRMGRETEFNPFPRTAPHGTAAFHKSKILCDRKLDEMKRNCRGGGGGMAICSRPVSHHFCLRGQANCRLP